MTEAQIRTAVRNMLREQSSDTGALFPAGDVLLDDMIDMALDMVVMDLVEQGGELPENFIEAEELTITADTRTTTPTNTSILQVWSANKNVSDETPLPLTKVPWAEHDRYEYKGQTDAAPKHYSMVGDVVHWIPTPASTVADYAKFLFIMQAEITGGAVTRIPAAAHRLIPLKAVIVAATAMNLFPTEKLNVMYEMFLKRIGAVLAHRTQHQARYLAGVQGTANTREITEYDPNWP